MSRRARFGDGELLALQEDSPDNGCGNGACPFYHHYSRKKAQITDISHSAQPMNGTKMRHAVYKRDARTNTHATHMCVGTCVDSLRIRVSGTIAAAILCRKRSLTQSEPCRISPNLQESASSPIQNLWTFPEPALQKTQSLF